MPRPSGENSREEKILTARPDTEKWRRFPKKSSRELQARERIRRKSPTPLCKSSKHLLASGRSAIVSDPAGLECRESTSLPTRCKFSFSKHSALPRWRNSRREPAGTARSHIGNHGQR